MSKRFLVGLGIFIVVVIVLARLNQGGDSTSVIQPEAATTNSTRTATTTTTPSATWHTAYTYTNSTLIQTPAFSMQGSEWKITYSCTPDSDAMSGMQPYFQGMLDDVTDNTTAQWFANDVDCPTIQTSYAYSQTPGQYYLDVGSAGASYTVTVEDYY